MEENNVFIKMRLFGFYGPFKKAYFDRLNELEYWCQNHNTSLGIKCIFDYLEYFAGEQNVIRVTTENGKTSFYTPNAIYNITKKTWQKCFIDINDIFNAFNERGIKSKKLALH